MKKSKFMILILTVLISAMLLTGCGEKAPAPDAGDTTPPVTSDETPATDDTGDTGDGERQTSADNKVVTLNGDVLVLDSPVYLTSVGQSADVSMLDALLKKVEADYTFDATAKAEDLEGAKTIIIASGASSKGLGAAGISADDEKARANDILKLAEEQDITIIMAHLGGVPRRGPLSDEFAEMVMDKADAMLVVEDGDDDGKFSSFSKEKNIPITLVNSIADSMEPLKVMFGK